MADDRALSDRLRPLRRGARHPGGGLPGRVRALDSGADGRAGCRGFEKVERVGPADGVVIEGDDL
jgi:hypothetical protein